MRLLFITQKVNRHDDLLGVYHEWIRVLAETNEQVTVICLEQGEFNLSPNVRVLSLGKEKNYHRWRYVARFYRFTWRYRYDYDTVLVHMNPEYLILGGLFWRLWRKRTFIWYAHYLKTFKLRLAVLLAHRVLTSVSEAFPYPSSKVIAVGQGIDTTKFVPRRTEIASSEARLLFLGRISPVKDLETLLAACRVLAERGVDFKLTIVGEAPPRDQAYEEKIRQLASQKILAERIEWKKAIAHYQTPEIYQSHDIYINLTRTGSFDKTTLEAMASGLPSLVANRAFERVLSPNQQARLIFKEKNAVDLAAKIETLIRLPYVERQTIGAELRDLVVKNHSLGTLGRRLQAAMLN